MDIMTILCTLLSFLCLILSFPAIIGCIILTVVGDWFERIICLMIIVVLIMAVVVIWKALGF